MASLQLYLLGPPRLERDGVALRFWYRKNIALLAYLAMTGGSHTREALDVIEPLTALERVAAQLLQAWYRRRLQVLVAAVHGERGSAS